MNSNGGMKGAADTALPLLAVAGLSKRYPTGTAAGRAGKDKAAAVSDVSFAIGSGRTLALVGESGSGKTTVARIVARLEEADTGSIRFDGADWLGLKGRALRRKRRDLQIVFQDPQTSLNPRMRAGDQIAEPLRVQRLVERGEIGSRVGELLAEVGLDPSVAGRFPPEFSGGQRQRIAIARALASRPKLLVCDEPVSALDASIAAQIVNLLVSLQESLGLSYLFISHDLSVVGRLADSVVVLYAGRVMEEGPFAAIAARPLHPYTAILVSAVPSLDRTPESRLQAPAGSVDGTPVAGKGCVFAPRCPIVRPRCREEDPPLFEWEPGRRAACFYPGELALPEG